MKELIKELSSLKKSNIKKTVDSRIKEFEAKGQGNDSVIFGELCFCLLTANFQAEKSIKIQEALGKHFHNMPEEKLALGLRQYGHRFPNMRAKFICEARQHKSGIKNRLHSFNTDADRRLWLAKNVKGLGMKESSHFLRNIGFKDCAIIDFHIVDKLAESGAIEKPKSKAITPAKYLEIELVLKKLGEKSGLNQAELDLYLWYSETGKILK